MNGGGGGDIYLESGYSKSKREKCVYLSIYIGTYKTLITLIVCLFGCLIVCLFEAVRTNPGYGMAALISNNLLNLISGKVILLRSS